jgi:hypothetical protein
MNKTWLAMGVAAAAIGFAAVGTTTQTAVAQETEQPKYTVISSAENIEIREYGAMIVAEASVPGDRGRAMSRGFRIIADYIFGNNLSSKKVAMTSPVTQQSNSERSGEKIAMTSPVTQQSQGETWQVRFIMPSEYTMETLPKPANPAVTLIEVPAKRVATIRFSGMPRQQSVSRYQADLEAYMAASDLTAAAAPTYAFYDGPWTPASRRRNEVMIELATEAE